MSLTVEDDASGSSFATASPSRSRSVFGEDEVAPFFGASGEALTSLASAAAGASSAAS